MIKLAYAAACKNVGVDCPGSFTTETKEEVLKHIDLHLKESHAGIELSPDEIRRALTAV